VIVFFRYFLMVRALLVKNYQIKLLRKFWYCCNLSGGVALIVWFTTNGMCAKNNTIIYVARASSSKRDCDVVALPILTYEQLNFMTSVREERLRRMISVVACCHGAKLCAYAARDFRLQQYILLVLFAWYDSFSIQLDAH